ncbi:hypothetical protein MSPP1_000450 [Malassezia sp. CBS 17886]|nr:hypothetical protein MSPP1_000450 [Malassezia sp. CBS 17886]
MPDATSGMLWIGAPCHECHREDFLPLLCCACRHPFCADHVAADVHACASPSRDFRVPLCPLCNEPPHGWRRDATPADMHAVLETHWAPGARGACAALYGCTARHAPQHVCARVPCGCVLHVPIQCPYCGQLFGTLHRAAAQHGCARAPRRRPEDAGASGRRSAIAAMRERHERGLLSPAEEVVLAKKMAEEAEVMEREKRKECVVM